MLNAEQAHRALRRLGVFLSMADMEALCNVPGVCFDGKIMCVLCCVRAVCVCVCLCVGLLVCVGVCVCVCVWGGAGGGGC